MSDTATVTTAARLRGGPSTTADIKETLAAGTQLTILSHDGEWFTVKVAATGVEGFVHQSLIQLPGVTIVSGFFNADAQVMATPLAPAAKKAAPAGGDAVAQKVAKIWNAYGGLLSVLAGRIGVEPEVGVAVMAVESGGAAFVNGRMVIRFENHIFWSQWGKANLDAYNAHFRFDANQRWTGHAIRTAADQPWVDFHDKGQDGEWAAFNLAATLNPKAARLSISMGLPQVMGFNASSVGYATVEAMFDGLSSADGGERAQVVALFDFIKGPRTTSPMLDALRAHDWNTFAKNYNGSGQVEVYGKRIAQHFAAAKSLVAG